MLSVRILVALALSLATLPFLAGSASAAVTQIVNDGNQDGMTDDWQGLAGTPVDPKFQLIHDPVGNADTTTFGTGSSESDYPSWTVGSPGTASDKSDIGNIYVYNYRSGGDLFVALAWDRAGDTGTGRYYVELNQLPNQGLVPTRSVGDRRITIGINGSDDLVCQRIERWNGSAWADATDCSSIPVNVNSGNIADYFNSPNDSVPGTLEGNTFVETVINLSDFGATSCPVSGYQSLTIRSQEGNEKGDTSALKDRATGTVDIPSDCGTIKIVKNDAATGQPVTVAGTKFSITPDPTAGSSQTGAKTVVDNNTSAADLVDTDPATGKITIASVDPDTYTVRELVPPAGYFLPPPAPDYNNCPTSGNYDCLKLTVTTPDGGSNIVTFTFTDKLQWAAPTVDKTVSAKYDASYAWAIDKTVANPNGTPGSSATQNIPAGTTATFDYAVTVTEGAQTRTNYRVTGTVSVGNSNSAAMTVTLSDKLSDNTVCTFPGVADISGAAGLQVSVPAGGADYGYTCSPGSNPSNGSNTATVTWDKGVYPQTQADANSGGTGTATTGAKNYTYTVGTETNKTVTITDSRHTFDPAWEITWSDEGATHSKSYQLSFTAPDGSCEDFPNTATLHQVGDDLTASANARVCGGSNLTVTKNKVVSLTRTYAYSIDKSVADSTLEVDPVTGKAKADYSVVVTDGAATDSDWAMSGQITVANPNDWAVTLNTISDSYEGTVCSVTTGADLVIPADDPATPAVDEGKRTFAYSCAFTSKPPYDGTNTATVTWDKAKASTSSDTASGTASVVEADWSLTKVNPTVHVVDNKTVPGASIPLGTVTWTSSGFKHPAFTYSLELAGTPGRCVDFNNVASITETGQSDSAQVTVCYPVNPTVDKTAGGTYDRTYLWEITKEADQTSVETDGTSAEVNYTVTAKPAGYTDGGWTMNGTITVSNPNDFKSMTVDITDVPNVGPGVTCTVTSGVGVVVPAGTLVNGKVVPGTASRSYICSVPQQPLYQGGTNTAVITWAGGSASSAAKPVVFALAGETNKTVNVIDDKTVEGDEIALGTATWNDLGTATEFTYSLDLEAAANECETYTNTAEIVETGQFADATVEACGPEVLPAEEVRPPVVKGVEAVLPSTGGPQLGLAWAGIGMLLTGGLLMAARRRGRFES